MSRSTAQPRRGAPHLKPNGPEPEPEPELRHVPKIIIIIGEKKTVYRRLAKTRCLDTTRRRSSRMSILGASCLLGTRPQEHRAQGALGAQVQAQGQAQAARLETRPAPRPKHKPKPTPSSTSRVVQTHAARLKTFDTPRSRPPPKAKSQEIKKYKDKATRIRVRVKRPHNADPEGGVLRTSAPPHLRSSSQRSTHPELKPTPQERTPHNNTEKAEQKKLRAHAYAKSQDDSDSGSGLSPVYATSPAYALRLGLMLMLKPTSPTRPLVLGLGLRESPTRLGLVLGPVLVLWLRLGLCTAAHPLRK
ncbi:hypothetical protein B0H13DRAFT_2499869 [Mycena leptocephala]|nr:hypothetical protein B0H13DRAFT_2499869 [Mycena leptocephala]